MGRNAEIIDDVMGGLYGATSLRELTYIVSDLEDLSDRINEFIDEGKKQIAKGVTFTDQNDMRNMIDARRTAHIKGELKTRIEFN